MSNQQSRYTEPEYYLDSAAGKFKSRQHTHKMRPKRGTEPKLYSIGASKKDFRIKHKVLPDRYEPVKGTKSKYLANGKLKPKWIAYKIVEMIHGETARSV